MVRSGFNDPCHELDGEAEGGSKILNVNVYDLHSRRTDLHSPLYRRLD